MGIGEGGARVGRVGREDAGQTKSHPVLAEHDVADRAILLGPMAFDPGEQGCRGVRVGLLRGERLGAFEQARRPPILDDLEAARSTDWIPLPSGAPERSARYSPSPCAVTPMPPISRDGRPLNATASRIAAAADSQS